MNGQKVSSPGEVTRLLRVARDGDPAALDRLLPLVYDELRAIARSQLRREQAGHTLQATALVNEAYLKLADQAGIEWRDRAHFLAVVARAMRQVLVEYARRRKADKRGGGWERAALTGEPVPVEIDPDEMLALDDALNGLPERQRQVVECRYFAGMTEHEIAEVLGVTPRTVQRDWALARAWLYRELYP